MAPLLSSVTKMVFGTNREKETSNFISIKKVKCSTSFYYQRRTQNKSADKVSAVQPQPENLYSVHTENGNNITIGRVRQKLVSGLKKSELSA